MAIPEAIPEKVRAGEPLDREEGVALLREGDFLEEGDTLLAVERLARPHLLRDRLRDGHETSAPGSSG